MSIPHPYEDGMAEKWIATLGLKINRGELASFAVTKISSGQLVGEVSLKIDQQSDQAALSYWIGEPYWGLGYCTEAASIIARYGFEYLHLNWIYATHLPRNSASGRVLQKIGMCLEGQKRRHNIKSGKYEDLMLYGMLREEWASVD